MSCLIFAIASGLFGLTFIPGARAETPNQKITMSANEAVRGSHKTVVSSASQPIAEKISPFPPALPKTDGPDPRLGLLCLFLLSTFVVLRSARRSRRW